MWSFYLKRFIRILNLTSIFIWAITGLQAQEFGRTKVHYETKNFRVKETPHFEIYHYLEKDSLINYWAWEAEKWHSAHQEIFLDTFNARNPLVLYSDHPDFQQTNTIGGLIGSGTGGVTESLKRRVVMPLSAVNSQTSHVLGHELVHAFQYHMLLNKNQSGMNALNNIPLWMIEGLAEYMSLGNIDANTAMWMRDAVLRNDVPRLKDLTKGYKYFPYRYGHAFWAFVGGTWGDTTLRPLFIKTGSLGYDRAIEEVLGVDVEAFSKMWKTALEEHYYKLGRDTAGNPVGRLLIRGKNQDEFSISPSISPNGRHIALISDRDVFTMDVYIADAMTGEIERKLFSTVSNSHIDELNFIESGVTWSPLNDRLALVDISRGKNKLVIIDAAGNSKPKEVEIPGVPAFSYPAWSPDGNFIAFSGLVDGQTDLYLYHLRKNSVLRLTNDSYSEIQPSWSPDGKFIAFSTDQPSDNLPLINNNGLNIAFMNMESGEDHIINIFPGAKNLNPQFSPDGESIYFLSDRDGFRDLYRYDLDNENVYQQTEYFTGISGITPFSPAISISPRNHTIAYTLFSGNKYRIYSASLSEFNDKKVDKDFLDQKAAMLPVFKPGTLNIVYQNLTTGMDSLILPADSVKNRPYTSRFKLDYVSNSGGVGVSTGGIGNRTGLNGGANLLFSDMLGDNYLFTGLSLNGEIYDFAGMVSYQNLGRRTGWGAAASHIPYRYSIIGYDWVPGVVNNDSVIFDRFLINNYRMFEENISLFGFYPFSQTTRLEFGGSLIKYSYRLDQERYYYLQGLLIDHEREKLEAPEGYSLQTVSAALIKDNSFFGLTSPMQGHRYRAGVNKYFGELDLYTFLLDFRKYFFINPYTLAFRIIHYSRLGSDAENDMLSPLSFAYPFLNRVNQFIPTSNDSTSGFNINQLYGSQILVGNIEFRIPFTGPEKLALINSHIIFTDLSFFIDAGLAWTKSQSPSLEYIPDNNSARVPYYTAGISYRINLFGYMVIEPYFAFPLQKSSVRKPSFGLNLAPGW